MACKKCSLLRCKVFGFVAGAKKIELVGACHDGTTCQFNGEYFNQIQLGDDWKTFPQFLRTLAKAIWLRIRGKDVINEMTY